VDYCLLWNRSSSRAPGASPPQTLAVFLNCGVNRCHFDLNCKASLLFNPTDGLPGKNYHPSVSQKRCTLAAGLGPVPVFSLRNHSFFGPSRCLLAYNATFPFPVAFRFFTSFAVASFFLSNQIEFPPKNQRATLLTDRLLRIPPPVQYLTCFVCLRLQLFFPQPACGRGFPGAVGGVLCFSSNATRTPGLCKRVQ